MGTCATVDCDEVEGRWGGCAGFAVVRDCWRMGFGWWVGASGICTKGMRTERVGNGYCRIILGYFRAHRLVRQLSSFPVGRGYCGRIRVGL